jgi:16S rRNA (uracil1498-N3)-methyltransferase
MSSLYLNLELDPAAIGVGAAVSISGAESRHAVTVGRARAGEQLAIGNGSGLVARGTVVSAAATELVIEVDAVELTPRPSPGIWLAQALAKGDRDELAIQAATELGVDGVIPWAAARSVSRWEGPKLAKGHERWSAIVREASKQSVRAWLPEVGALVSTKQLAALASTAQLIVLDPLAADSLSQFTLTFARTGTTDSQPPLGQARQPRDVVLVVGPEGGIAPHELEILSAAGATGAKLGDTILRTSTAGPAAIAVLNAKLGRW